MTDLIERSAAIEAYESRKYVGSIGVVAALEAPAHRFTREDVENAARAHCDHFGEQGWFDSGESHEPKTDMIEAMAVALSAIGEVDGD